jgi:hypothetical protein
LKVDSQGSRVTSDGGLILVRELDEHLGFGERIEGLTLGGKTRSIRWRPVAPVRFYNKRGTAEQWLKENKQAVKLARLICTDSVSNEVRLGLSVLTYNLGDCDGACRCPAGSTTGR